MADLVRTRKDEDRFSIDRPDEEHTQDVPKRPGRAAGVIGRGETGPGPGATVAVGGIIEGLAKHEHTDQYIENMTRRRHAARTSPLSPSRQIRFGSLDSRHGRRGGGGEALGCSLPSCRFVHDFPCWSGLDRGSVINGRRGGRRWRRGRWFLGLEVAQKTERGVKAKIKVFQYKCDWQRRRGPRRRLTGGVQLGEYSPPAPCFDLTAINSAISLFVRSFSCTGVESMTEGNERVDEKTASASRKRAHN